MTHGVPPSKIVWLLFFEISTKGVIWSLIIWGTLHFKDLKWIWLSKVNGPVLSKERWIKGFVYIYFPKPCVHTEGFLR